MSKQPKFELKPTTNKVAAADLETNNIATEEMVDAARKAFDEENTKYNEYNFLVKLNKATCKILLDFLGTKAKWKFRNAFGVKECYETIQSALADLESGKSKAVYLKSLELQAIAFFVANHEDVGYEYAKDYVLIVDPLFECMQESQKWRNKVELLRQKFVLYEDSFEQQLPIEDVNLKDIAEKEQKVAESEITV